MVWHATQAAVASDGIAYRSRPYVCGAIGPWDPAVVQRLRQGSPAGLREIHRSSRAVLLASRALGRWNTAGGGQGFFWDSLADGATPATWQSAAEERLAAGLFVSDHEAVLHGDALGMQQLYVRRLGATCYFSVRIEALLTLDDSPLHTDWSAWADIFAVICSPGEATQFEEVRRLGAAAAMRAGSDSVTRIAFEPGWLSAEPDRRVSPRDALDVVASHIPRRGRMGITLSGGWDSRLLALAARRVGQRPTAWTTTKDEGYDHDLAYARPVADALGLRHRVVVPGPEAWLDEHRAVWRRLSHQTNHHVWIMPLARVLHRRTDTFLDGLAGDLLFKGSYFARWESTAAATAAAQRRLIWDGLTHRRLLRRHLLAPGVADAFEDLSRASFDRAVSRFDGHHDATTLSVLHTRTARAIALCPHWLLAPEATVQVPFIHPEVVRVALSIPWERKAGGGFYREMMFAANPDVAGLPSTHDDLPRRNDLSRQRSSRALGALASSILARPEVLQLLGPEMRRALKDPTGLELMGCPRAGLYLLQWAGMLADWRDTHGARLADGGLEVTRTGTRA
jgi:asparagine synthetase B (glutamine-hydrolysing)